MPGDTITTVVPACEDTTMDVLMKCATEAIDRACAEHSLSHGPIEHISSAPWTEPLAVAGGEDLPPAAGMVLHRFKAVAQ